MPRVGINGVTRAEGDAVSRSMDDPTVKAMTVISGILLDLTVMQRRAVVSFLLSTVAAEGVSASPLRLQDGSSITVRRDYPADGNGSTSGD